MNKIADVKHQLNIQQWAQQIAECRQSGMTVTAWCRSQGIGTNTYYYRLKKVREHAVENLPVSVCKAPVVTEKTTESTISFKRVEVQSPITDMAPAVIIHMPQASVEVRDGVSQQTVEAVLLALKSLC